MMCIQSKKSRAATMAQSPLRSDPGVVRFSLHSLAVVAFLAIFVISSTMKDYQSLQRYYPPSVGVESNPRTSVAIITRNNLLSDGDKMYFNEAMREFPKASQRDIQALKEQTRFVLFLCNQEFFKGALALLQSLSESAQSTSLPPLVIVAGNSTLKTSEITILETLGAQVRVMAMPNELNDALSRQVVQKHNECAFIKLLLFVREMVQSDIVFNIDVDSVVQGDVIQCMSGLLQYFRSKPNLDLMAQGSRAYFNNGVMLARPRKATYSYMVEMLRNGACMGNCTESDHASKMKRRVGTDQDIFNEYTKRFPERYQPIHKSFSFNVRPMQHNYGVLNGSECAVLHFADIPKPWNEWLRHSENRIQIANDITPLIRLPETFPEHMLIEKQRRGAKERDVPLWAVGIWRDVWNTVVDKLLLKLNSSHSPGLPSHFNASIGSVMSSPEVSDERLTSNAGRHSLNLSVGVESFTDELRWKEKMMNFFLSKECKVVDPHFRPPSWLQQMFVLIGVQKGGTKAIHTFLETHPDFVSRCNIQQATKELFFFNKLNASETQEIIHQDELQARYAGMIQNVCPLAVDALTNDTNKMYLDDTPTYMQDSHFMPQLLSCVMPKSKIMVILRNPTERAFSHYNYYLERNWCKRKSFDSWVDINIEHLTQAGVLSAKDPLDELLAWERYNNMPIDRKCRTFVTRGLYVIQLLHFKIAFEAFGRQASDMLVIRSEDLQGGSRQLEYDKMLNFLGLEPHTLKGKKSVHKTLYEKKMENSTREKLNKIFQPFNRRLFDLLDWETSWG